MTAMPTAAMLQVLLSLLLGTGLNGSHGVPPDKEDPLLAKLAPADVLLYHTWVGTATPDANSPNQTEQLMAEPDVRRLFVELEQRLQALTQPPGAAGGAGNEVTSLMQLYRLLSMHAAAFYIAELQPPAAEQPNAATVKAGLLANLGDDLPQARTLIQSLVRGQPVEIVEINKTQCLRLATPAGPVHIGFRGKYLLVGIGEGQIEAMFERLRGEPPAWLNQVRQELAVERLSGVSYLNLKKVLEIAKGAGGPRATGIIEALELGNLTQAAVVTGLDGTSLVSRAKLTATGDLGGPLSLADATPLTAADLKSIPRDAPVAVVKRVSLEKVWNLALDIATKFDPNAADQLDQALRQPEQELGINLRNDLVKSLGDRWTLVALPSEGGVLTGWTVAVQVRDRERLAATLGRLAAFINRQTEPRPAFVPGPPRTNVPRVTPSRFGDADLYSLSIPAQGFPLGLTLGLSNDELVLGLFPQSVKAYLSRGKDEPSLATQPEVAKLLAAKPAPFVLAYADERQTFRAAYPFVQLAAQAMLNELARATPGQPGLSFPPGAVVERHLQTSLTTVSRTKDGLEIVSRQTLPGGNVVSSGPVALALLLPAVQAGRAAAQRTNAMNNLKQIGLALHNFHDVNNGFPASYSTDKTGRPLLSWRVHILPYLDEQPLYDRFHLDEPWDSEHNRKLIPLMPKSYQAPSGIAEPGKTNYLGIRGADKMFDAPATKGTNLGISFAAVTDGTSNTIAVVEASNPAAVIWTKPDDLDVDDKDPLKGLVGVRPGGFLAVLCDGSVRFIAQTVNKDTLKWLFSRNDGNVVGDLP